MNTTESSKRSTDSVTIDRETLTELADAYVFSDFHVIKNRDGTFDLVRHFGPKKIPLCFFHRLPLDAVSAMVCRANDNTWGLLDELLVSESLEGYEYEYQLEEADDNPTDAEPVVQELTEKRPDSF